jgi:putative ABC transport system permease protein
MSSSPVSLFASLGSDIRIAARGLRRNAGFAWAAVLTLGLAVGGMTAMLTVANAVLFRPLPFPDPDRLVSLCESHPQVAGFCVASTPNVSDWGRASHSLAAVGAARDWPMTLTQEGRNAAVRGGLATEGTFRALGVSPALGRLLEPGDHQAGNRRVALVSHALWVTRLGGASGIVGRTIRLEDSAYTVVGVLPAGFDVPLLEGVEVWTPPQFDPAADDQRDWRGFQVFARLAPGVSLASATAELESIQAGLADLHPAADRGWGVEIHPLRDRVVGQVRPALLAFLGATVLAVLIACLNVATLLLARWSSRGREIAVRAALGGGRGAIVRLLLLESLLLALAGSILGLLIGPWATRAFLALAPQNIPRLDQVVIDPAVFGAALLIGVAVPVLAGVAPALRSTSLNLAGSLRAASGDGRPGRELLRRGLVVIELGLAVVLLVGAGLLGRSFLNLLGWSPGFERQHLVTVWTLLPPARFPRAEDVRGTYRAIREEVSAVPGVDGVGQVSAGPLFGGSASPLFGGRETDGFRDSKRPAAEPLPARWYDAGPDYFKTLGTPILRGRGITAADVTGAPAVAVVNEAFARRMWPGEDPIGHRITAVESGGDPMEVVGLLADIPPFGAREPAEAEVYWPFEQQTRWASYLVIRVTDQPERVGKLVAERLAERFPDLQLSRTRTLPQLVQARLVSPRFSLLLISAFAGIAVLIAGIGVFGVVNFLVTRRRREIGIRMALGADLGQVLRGVMREGIGLALYGSLLGLAGAIGVGRLIASMLAGVSPVDPVTLVLVPVGLASVAAVAAFLPALRAARTDPLVVLRAE